MTTRAMVAAALAACTLGLTAAACAPTAPPPGGPSGCGRAAAPAYAQERLLRSGGIIRTFLLTIPEDYDPDVPTPLLLNFHGLGSNAIQQAAYSQLDLKGMQRGFIVATPDGINGVMDVLPPSIDQTYVLELVRYLSSILCVSPTARFSAGMSMGGFMSGGLACLPELNLKAIAGVTGLLGACDNGRTMPVLHFHGTLDPIVPYSAAQGAVASWAERNGCGTTPVLTRIPPDIEVRTYQGCAPGRPVVFYTVIGGGHTWPDGVIDFPAGVTTRTINASNLILDFFSAQ